MTNLPLISKTTYLHFIKSLIVRNMSGHLGKDVGFDHTPFHSLWNTTKATIKAFFKAQNTRIGKTPQESAAIKLILEAEKQMNKW